MTLLRPLASVSTESSDQLNAVIDDVTDIEERTSNLEAALGTNGQDLATAVLNILAINGFTPGAGGAGGGPVGTNPSKPIGVSASGGINTLTVSYVPQGDGGSPVFVFTAYTSDGYSASATDGDDIVFTNYPASTNLTVYVVATNANGDSDHSDLSSPVSVSNPPLTVPDPPLFITVRPGAGYAILSGTEAANNGGSPVTQWQFFAIGGGTTQEFDDNPSSPGTVTATLSANDYVFYARTVNAIGPSGNSDTTGVYTISAADVAPPQMAAPTLGTVNGDGSVTLNFVPPTVPSDFGSQIDHFTITSNSGATISVNAFVTSATIFDTIGAHTYKVTATNVSNLTSTLSPASATITVTGSAAATWDNGTWDNATWGA